MEIYVLDSTYALSNVIDSYKSFIWTERYREAGDFELVIPYRDDLFEVLPLDAYLSIESSKTYMIVESIQVDSDFESGSVAIISGRSLESILDRRVIWGQTQLTGKFQDGIKTLLNQNAISPSNTNRKIPDFTFIESKDTDILALTIDAQYYGDSLYDAIVAQCEEQDLGFRVLPSGAGGFTFELYRGADRSYQQDANPFVVFSPAFDNVISSNYLRSRKPLKTAAMVAGSGSGGARTIVEATTSDGGGAGLTRRELYTDASDISTTTSSGSSITASVYQKQLKQKGTEALADNKEVKSFEGEMDVYRQFVYGVDFFMGDIIQIQNEHGIESRSRITELVRSDDDSGSTTIPTFTSVD